MLDAGIQMIVHISFCKLHFAIYTNSRCLQETQHIIVNAGTVAMLMLI